MIVQIDELVSQEVFDEKCGKQLCVIAFLPDIMDSGMLDKHLSKIYIVVDY